MQHVRQGASRDVSGSDPCGAPRHTTAGKADMVTAENDAPVFTQAHHSVTSSFAACATKSSDDVPVQSDKGRQIHGPHAGGGSRGRDYGQSGAGLSDNTDQPSQCGIEGEGWVDNGDLERAGLVAGYGSSSSRQGSKHHRHHHQQSGRISSRHGGVQGSIDAIKLMACSGEMWYLCLLKATKVCFKYLI
jgi:hypothetical protein